MLQAGSSFFSYTKCSDAQPVRKTTKDLSESSIYNPLSVYDALKVEYFQKNESKGIYKFLTNSAIIQSLIAVQNDLKDRRRNCD